MASRTEGAWRRWLAAALRWLLAAVFVVSAVAKLMSIDDFELYVFSYGFFPLNVAYIVARGCIVAELLAAVLIASGWWPRTVRLLTLAMLTGFSLFLCYAALAGRNESCRCFGRLVDIPPAQSLLKNAVLIVLTLLAYGLCRPAGPRWSRRLRLWLTGGAAVVLSAAVFTVSVPDNWMFGSGSAPADREALSRAFASGGGLAQLEVGEGNRLVAFVTPGCPYCRMARQKLASIAERNCLPDGAIVYVEPAADDGGVSKRADGTWQVPADLFMALTRGNRPYIVLLEDGQPTLTFHYRNIGERRIVRSLKANIR